MSAQTAVPTYHVLLIGIDRYPPGYNSLTGCVNDIDAIEQLLLAPPGIGVPAERIYVTRVAASHPHRPSGSRFQAQTLPPTKANLIQALASLAGPQVNQSDRVLIYYSGHGHEQFWTGSEVWHEALVPHDGQRIDFLYDVEVNVLINAIAARTNDLTIVLDCCHSAGATRDLSGVQALGADRTLAGNVTPGEPPDLAMLATGSPGTLSASTSGPPGMLQTLDPDYLVIVACLPDEKAGEGAYPGEQRPYGILTYSLVSLLSGKDARARAELRWADIWPECLDKVSQRCRQLGRRPQHPWYIGRNERRIFGGPWEEQDVGYRVTGPSDGRYTIGAGTLMGLSREAEVAVYGPTPPRFPRIGSLEEQSVGRLRVVEAGRATCTAISSGTAFHLPEGARGRLLKPGESERLRVVLKPDDASLSSELGQSPLLEIVSEGPADAEVEVTAQHDGSWTIGNDVEAVLACVPPTETAALRAGLDWYYRYQTVLRLARNCNDLELNRSLSVRLLDCTGPEAWGAMTQEQLADPQLPEVRRDKQGIYFVKPNSRSCVKVSNASEYTLQVTLLNCSAGGLVEYMGEASLSRGASQMIWSRSEVGKGFPAMPDDLPVPYDRVAPLPFVTDRLIAIGTTRRDADMNYLRVDKTFQQVVDENVLLHGTRAMTEDAVRISSAPLELWTATLTPLRIHCQ